MREGPAAEGPAPSASSSAVPSAGTRKRPASTRSALAPAPATRPPVADGLVAAYSEARAPRASQWSPPPPPSGSRRPALSRARIVAAAIELADADGLEAVSIRRLAAHLSARPMTLHAHIGSKDDLLGHMIESIRDEATPDSDGLPAHWRDALRALAVGTRDELLRHPWILSLVGRRVPLGRGGLKHLEASLAAVSGLDVDQETKIDILTTVDTYTLGHALREIANPPSGKVDEADAGTATGFVDWLNAATDLVRAAPEPAEFPHTRAFGPVIADSLTGSRAGSFERGLDWVLAGIEASLSSVATARPGTAASSGLSAASGSSGQDDGGPAGTP